MLNDRRAQLLRAVASQTGLAKTADAAGGLILEALQSDPFDIPFALLYLIDPDGKHAHLCHSIEFALDRPVSPASIDLVAEEDPNSWMIALATRTTQTQVITDLVARFDRPYCCLQFSHSLPRRRCADSETLFDGD